MRDLGFSLSPPGTPEGEEGQQGGSLGLRPAPLAALQVLCLWVPRLWAAPTRGSWSVFSFFSPENGWKSIGRVEKRAQGPPPGTVKNTLY